MTIVEGASSLFPQIAQTLFNWVICLSVAVPLPAIVISYTRLLTHKLNQIERVVIDGRIDSFKDAFGYNLRDVVESASAVQAKTSSRATVPAPGNGNGSSDRRKGERRNPEFQNTFRAYYNWYSYALGLGFVAIVSVGFAVAALAKLGLSFDPLPANVQLLLSHTAPRALAAAAGAYLFGAYDAVRRYRTVDLYPSVLHYLWVRMLVAAFIGYVVGAPFKEPADVLAAFAVGVFPLGDLWAWLRTRVDIGRRDDVEGPSLRLIQGLETEEARDRLADEGISSVQQLAYADPVGLLFRTNLEWNVILDLIDQAILVLYVGESIDKLRAPGIRSAVEFATIDNRLEGDDPDDAALAGAIVTSTAARLEMTESEVRNIAFQLNNDPVVEFIWEQWNKTVGTEEGEPKIGMLGGAPEQAGVPQIAVSSAVPAPN
ncbi:MAG TPA: hypothetical protein VF461_12710 [Gemmatimonadaceae bacterium]